MGFIPEQQESSGPRDSNGGRWDHSQEATCEHLLLEAGKTLKCARQGDTLGPEVGTTAWNWTPALFGDFPAQTQLN